MRPPKKVPGRRQVIPLQIIAEGFVSLSHSVTTCCVQPSRKVLTTREALRSYGSPRDDKAVPVRLGL